MYWQRSDAAKPVRTSVAAASRRHQLDHNSGLSNERFPRFPRSHAPAWERPPRCSAAHNRSATEVAPTGCQVRLRGPIPRSHAPAWEHIPRRSAAHNHPATEVAPTDCQVRLRGPIPRSHAPAWERPPRRFAAHNHPATEVAPTGCQVRLRGPIPRSHAPAWERPPRRSAAIPVNESTTNQRRPPHLHGRFVD